MNCVYCGRDLGSSEALVASASWDNFDDIHVYGHLEDGRFSVDRAVLSGVDMEVACVSCEEQYRLRLPGMRLEMDEP